MSANLLEFNLHQSFQKIGSWLKVYIDVLVLVVGAFVRRRGEVYHGPHPLLGLGQSRQRRTLDGF